MSTDFPVCAHCGKNDYPTRTWAQLNVLRMRERGEFLEVYRCPREGGYHLRSIDKRIAKFSQVPTPGSLAEIARLKREREKLERKDPDTKNTPGRRLAAASVAAYLRRVPTGREARLRRHNKFRRTRRRHRGRTQARADCPQGGTLVKMMAWANGTSYCHADFHPRYRKGEEIRRRNRKREKEAWQREAQRESTVRSR